MVKKPHFQHPGGGVGALGEGLHALLGGKVGHQLLRLMPGGPAVDGTPAALQQQQLIEGLHAWANSGQAREADWQWALPKLRAQDCPAC